MRNTKKAKVVLGAMVLCLSAAGGRTYYAAQDAPEAAVLGAPAFGFGYL